MGAMHVAIARVPGWRITRLFAAIAFTAAGYNAISIIFSTGGFPDKVYLAAGDLIYLVGTIHAVCWILYAYSDKNGSLEQAPKFIMRLAIAALLAGVVVTSSGRLFYPRVGLVEIYRAGVTYHFPLTTLLGDAYGFALAALGGVAFARLWARYRRGESLLKWQLAFYCVFLFCAVDEVLVANRLVKFPSLLDIGFVMVVAPLTLDTVRRISNDELRLRELSRHLKGEVARRTEERDEVRKALQETQEDLRVSSLEPGRNRLGIRCADSRHPLGEQRFGQAIGISERRRPAELVLDALCASRRSRAIANGGAGRGAIERGGAVGAPNERGGWENSVVSRLAASGGGSEWECGAPSRGDDGYHGEPARAGIAGGERRAVPEDCGCGSGVDLGLR